MIRHVEKLNRVMSLSSWFFHEKLGMGGFECLGRCSCFLIPKINKNFFKKYHIISVSHTTHPYLFRNYYDTQWDWLKHIDEDTPTMTRFEYRDCLSGNLLEVYETEQKTYRHPALDLVVCHLKDCEDFFEEQLIKQHKVNPILVDQDSLTNRDNVDVSEVVDLVGYSMGDTIEDLATNVGSYTTETLTVTTIEKSKIFGKTSNLIQHGMCGGLAFKGGNVAVGMLEGKVLKDMTSSQNSLLHQAVIIPIRQIVSFLYHIENDYLIMEEEKAMAAKEKQLSTGNSTKGGHFIPDDEEANLKGW